MKVLRQLPSSSTDTPTALSIGSFDGMHLGHQSIIRELTYRARQINGQSVVLSFQNHPRELLHPGLHVPRLCRETQKVCCLETLDVDTLVLLPFTHEFSQQSPQEFLHTLRQAFPFRELILGPDARIGKKRSGTPEVLHALAKEMGFSLSYQPPYLVGEEQVCSSRIRVLISEGRIEEAAKMLGRPFTMMGEVKPGAGKGQDLGFATANIDVTGLCLPPLGVYAASVWMDNTHLHGIANLGHAPTLQNEREVQLELHLWDFSGELYSKELEVQLDRFIRPEKTFSSAEELRQQIELDIQKAKTV